VAERVIFEGYQPFERFPSYIAASSVCLIPHLKSDHTDTTIPHKLFHYMLLGKPVVTADCRPLRRIVEETGCGVVHRSGDPDAFATAVASLTDKALRRQMGEAGQQAVRERYHWDRDARRLTDLYEGLASGTSSSPSASSRS
jgi:glycosyltransferase involved in cell wall biosynthesis